MNVYRQKWVRIFCWFKKERFAVVLFGVAFYSVPKDQVTRIWMRHEDCHKLQWKRYWYIGFLPVYLYQRFKYGYKKCPLEVEAREYASDLRSDRI